MKDIQKSFSVYAGALGILGIVLFVAGCFLLLADLHHPKNPATAAQQATPVATPKRSFSLTEPPAITPAKRGNDSPIIKYGRKNRDPKADRDGQSLQKRRSQRFMANDGPGTRVGGLHGNMDLEMTDLMNMNLGPEARRIVGELYSYMEHQRDFSSDTIAETGASQNFVIRDEVMQKKWNRLMDLIAQNSETGE